MEKNKLHFRKAGKDDIAKIFALSNDECVRKNSVHHENISWETHRQWFAKKISDVTCCFYIAEDSSNNFVGQARIDCQDENVISISIDKQYRGCGYAAEIIKKVSVLCGRNNIIAYIRPTNIKSLRAFISAGYRQISNRIIAGEEYICCIYNRAIFIIAEMSANHCGDKALAKKIIKKAKDCGADAVKIQTYTADTLTIDCRSDLFRINGGTLWDNKFLYDLYKEAYTPWEWQSELKAYADSIGITLFSTPFDKTAVDFLETIDCPMYKIASFEAIDIPLVKYTARMQKPMIVSTGICSEKEIWDVIGACKSVGNDDITLLKCTSAYPAKPENMNLLTISDMTAKFGRAGVKVGLSDHSMNVETVIAAVALGAKVIEKHFTLDRALGGADAGFSLNPEEFSAMVRAVRITEKLLGKIDYSVSETNRVFARSLFVVKDIKKGEHLTTENIRSIRPSYGLAPKFFDDIIGKTAARDLKLGTPLQWEDIC